MAFIYLHSFVYSIQVPIDGSSSCYNIVTFLEDLCGLIT